MSCAVGCRHGSDLALLWLWCRPAATALIRPLAWEPPYAMGAALKRLKTKRKGQQITNAGEDVEKKGTLLHCWWACKLVQPLWKAVWRYLRNLNVELPYDPEILLLGIYLDKTCIEKDTRTPMFITALFTIVKTWKQPRCPSTEEWIKKMWCICTMEYY